MYYIACMTYKHYRGLIARLCAKIKLKANFNAKKIKKFGDRYVLRIHTYNNRVPQTINCVRSLKTAAVYIYILYTR